MQGFAKALEARDVEGLLQYFSKKKKLRYLGTIESPNQSDWVTYEVLARDLRAHDEEQGWYSALLGSQEDSLALCAESAKGRPWKRAGKAKFVLPDDDLDSTLYVLWRREGAAWVVDTIAVPAA